jgi:hypothetical protein
VSQKVRLKSAARHVYAGRLLHVGDEFDADPSDADDLVALHFAVVVPTVMATTDAPALLATPKRRTYRRRDLRAES